MILIELQNNIKYFFFYLDIKIISLSLHHQTKTNIMNTKELTIISTEEFSGETVLFMSNGSEVKFETSKLIDFIEKNKWNYEYEYAGNNSPRNDGDPCYDLEAHVEVMTPEEYLDLEFDHVCKNYYLFEILKNK